MTRSAPKLLLLLEDHQDIKRRPRHQDKTRQGGEALACLLAWMDLARMDGSYAWIGSENSVQDSSRNTPRCSKSKITQYRKGIQYIQYIFVLRQSIYMRKRNTFKFPIQKHFSRNSFQF